ncbi:unnamed protein product [Zymoseptoria tritici ST99CH_1A5]|uniref:CBM1 domain-containing protein n=1 Tax=Zymoseptoria tritici ST99CH_1A5 TaxID=1276529 RepID=A0A1Y6LEE3_ZYMTR|nr:unnamed protein product [Zymoseptoria tritici ST99CH_1A5]
MQFFYTVAAALFMASSVSAGLDCWGYCQCLHNDGSHCCVDTTYGAAANGGTATKSGEDCEARCGTRQVYGKDGKPVGCGSSKWSCVSGWNGQFRTACVPEWVQPTKRELGQEEPRSIQAKPMGQAWPKVE